MRRGSKPNQARRRETAELRAQGLSGYEIARRLGTTHQNVYYLLKAHEGGQSRSIPCCDCGTPIPSAWASLRDTKTALCLACLAKHPDAPFSQRLKALRLAAGLTRAALVRKAGLNSAVLYGYEKGSSTPKKHNLAKLVAILGEDLLCGEEAPESAKER